MTVKEAVREVAKWVYAKWFHDTIYCISLNAIQDRLEKMWNIFKEGNKRFNAGLLDGKAVKVLNLSGCIGYIIIWYCRNTRASWQTGQTISLILLPLHLSRLLPVSTTGVWP